MKIIFLCDCVAFAVCRIKRTCFVCESVAKLGTPNKRIETLFRHMPEVRQLGMLHYKMTMTASLKAEEIEKH